MRIPARDVFSPVVVEVAMSAAPEGVGDQMWVFWESLTDL